MTLGRLRKTIPNKDEQCVCLDYILLIQYICRACVCVRVLCIYECSICIVAKKKKKPIPYLILIEAIKHAALKTD